MQIEIHARLTFGRRSLLDLRLSNVRQIVERRVFSTLCLMYNIYVKIDALSQSRIYKLV